MGKLTIDNRTMLPKGLNSETQIAVTNAIRDLEKADIEVDKNCGIREGFYVLIDKEKALLSAYIDGDYKTVVDMYDELYAGFNELMHVASYSTIDYILREMHNIRIAYAVSKVMVDKAA